ncbi:MAG: exodeoxyribonuclease V subunit gamma [Idiomarina sp.]
MGQLTPGFIVAHSHKMEALTDLVVKITGDYPLHPLETETILVQSNGIAQWLKLAMAEQNGIAAMLDVTLPARFLWQAYRAVLGDAIPKTSPFDKDRLSWRILRLLPQLLEDPDFAPLHGYLQNDADHRKHYQLSERLADLFDQYQIYRSDWLADWAGGGNAMVEQQAYQQQRWQPKLWRALLDDVGAEDYWNNRAQLHQRFLSQARQHTLTTRPAQLPRRVVVFGISSLPQQTLEVLDALKGHTQIVLCVHNPCQFHWADIVDGRQELSQLHIPQQRFDYKQGITAATSDDLLHTQTHPLLASWGKQGRDYIRLLDLFDETRHKAEEFNELSFELFDDQAPENTLQQLQSDILQLRSLTEIQAAERGSPDASVVFQQAHSPQREVEILHDQLLAAFAENPHLRPRDMMVMVPDIDTYAPHIQAVFGRFERSDERYIPFTIADLAQRQRNPLLIVLERLLNAPQERFSMSDVLDMLQVPALQAHFGISDSDLPVLQQWIQAAGIRWGLHGRHRESLGLPAQAEQNSWRFGLRRMLLGYAAGDTRPGNQQAWQNIEPFAEVGGLQAALAGPLAQLLDNLDNLWQQLQHDRTPSAWVVCFNQLLSDFFAPQCDADVLLLARVQEQLRSWQQACEDADFSDSLPLNIAREAWLSRLDQAQLNQRFLAGAVNFATLMPMRAIPFQQLYLLGMNDGDYPRSSKPLDFDLMAHQSRPGDRSRREDDRYLFLEALLSARQKFYVSWIGRSIQDNSARPPSVLVSQLLEHLEQGWAKPAVTAHALQPFAASYFNTAEPKGLFTFAHEWQHAVGAAVGRNEQVPAANGLAELSRWRPESPLTLKQLADFLREPARLLFQQRLNVYLYQQQLSATDEELFSSDGLQSWQQVERLIQAMQRAAHQQQDITAATSAELNRLQREGELPPAAGGEFEQLQLTQVINQVGARYQQLRERASKPLLPVHGSFELAPAGTADEPALLLQDNLDNLYESASGERYCLQLCASNLRAGKKSDSPARLKHASLPWVTHLLLNSQQPTRFFIAGRDSVLHLPPLAAGKAEALLAALGNAVLENFRQPLPITLDLAEQAEAKDLASQYDYGGFRQSALKERAPYCSRVFPSFSHIRADGRFDGAMAQLYAPLIEVLQAGDEWLQEQQLLTEAST